MAKRKKVPEKISVEPLRKWLEDPTAEPGRRSTFSKNAGYSSATVTNWIKRGAIPRGEISRVAAHMGLTEERYRELAGAPVLRGATSKHIESASLSEKARQIALAWDKLPPARQQAFQDQIFLEAVVAQHYPWLIRGRPPGESYDEFERSAEREMIGITGRLMMTEKPK